MRFTLNVSLVMAMVLIVAISSAQAGTMHPALQDRLAQVADDQAVSVIVHLTEQADIPGLDASLRASRASRKDRHQEVVLALQAAARSQEALKADLAASKTSGGVFGYTSYWISNLMVVSATKAEVERIAARPDVDFVELNFTPELIEPVSRGGGSDPDGEVGGEATRQIGVTPGLRAIRAPEVWYDLGFTGLGRLIGSLDTGVDGSHPALAARWRGVFHPHAECWLDVLGNGTTTPADFHDHGTHTTGTMCGVAPDDTIGVAWQAMWIATNAIDQGVSDDFDNDIIQCFEWFTDPDGDPGTVDDVPDVVQNSWGINEGFPGGYTDCDSRWWVVIDNCEAAGVVTCWSAGNEGPTAGSLRSPADRATTPTNCYSIGALDATNYSFPYPIASFSSRGPSGCDVPPENRIKPEVSAPGVDVYSSVPGGGYEGSWSGTSMAGPHVAGVVALMRQANPDLDVEAIKFIIMETAVDLGTEGEDNVYGWGLIDAYAAVQAAITGFGQIEGFAYNASFGDNPIDGVQVELLGTNYRYTTDATGYYHGYAAPETYTARAYAPGFEPQELPVDIVNEQVSALDFYLTDIAGPQISDVGALLISTDPDGPFAVTATVTDNSTVASVMLYYRYPGGDWQQVAMIPNGDVFEGNLPGAMGGSSHLDYYLTAQDGIGLSTAAPANAPVDFFTLYFTDLVYTYNAEDPDDPAWQLGVPGDQADTGTWVRVDPVGTNWDGNPVQPEDDHTDAPGVACFVTGNAAPGEGAGTNDVDHGCTTLVSPTFALTGFEKAFVHYWRWYGEDGNSIDDDFVVEVSSNGGTSWVELERVVNEANSWQLVQVDLTELIDLTDQVVFRFLACDENTQGLVEVGIDDFEVQTWVSGITAVDPADAAPERSVFMLAQNQPNPFNPSTTIQFAIPRSARVELAIYAVDGRRIVTLVNEELPAGDHQAVWNGRDARGQAVASGTYFYKLVAGTDVMTKRMVLVK